MQNLHPHLLVFIELFISAPTSGDRLTIILASCFSVLVVLVVATIVIVAIGK